MHPAATSLFYLIVVTVTGASGRGVLSKLGLGDWWGPPGLISVSSVEELSLTLHKVPVEPWWTEGTFPANGIRGFIIPATPADACSDLEALPDPDSLEESSLRSNLNESTFFLLAEKGQNPCDYETQVLIANSSGYAGLIIRNAGSETPEKLNGSYYFSYDYDSFFGCSVGAEDGSLLQANFSYPLYSVLIEDKRSTHFHNIAEIVIVTLAILVGLLLIILICTGLGWCCRRVRESLSQYRAEQRVKLLNATISNLPIRKWTRVLDTLSEENKVCRICREAFRDDEEIRILPCTHIFHLICIDQWIVEGRAYCRTCKHMLLPPDPRFVPSDVSDSGEYTLLGPGSENSPLIRGAPVLASPGRKTEGPGTQAQLQVPHETFFDASFESVLHAPPMPRRRGTESLQKTESPGEEPTALQVVREVSEPDVVIVT